MKLNEYIISVGSNIEPGFHIKKAGEELSKISNILKQSELIYTRPLLYPEQPDFLNGAFLIQTQMNPAELKEHLKKIEFKLGRIRISNKNGPRTIDLDIIIFNGNIVDNNYFTWDFLQNAVRELKPEFQIKDTFHLP